MLGLWRLSCDNGTDRGVLTFYILHTLDRGPNTGYGILTEIEEKTGGEWVPSKGTVYPLLNQLEDEGLIQLSGVEDRSKKVFELTPEGKKVLSHIHGNREQLRERFSKFRDLFIDILEEDKRDIAGLVFDVKETAFELPPEHRDEGARALEQCLSELRRLK